MQHWIVVHRMHGRMNIHPMYRSERIRELREAHALTQTELARRAHATQPTMSRIEKGEIKDRPDRPLAQRIARALGVELADVFEDPKDEAPATERLSGEVYDAGAFEAAVLRVVDPKVHMIVDLHAAVRAFGEATKASGLTRDPDSVARVWLEAARALRVDGLPTTPAAVMARVAMRETA
jgi:transcriptional regulator with XRE-family HTH domain